MNPQPKNHHSSKPGSAVGDLSLVQVKPAPSPGFPASPLSSNTPITFAKRRIAIAVDMSEESAYAVNWAIQNYLRPGDEVILLHVRPTSVLYGADWGSIPTSAVAPSSSPLGSTSTSMSTLEREQMEDDFDNFTNTKAVSLGKPLAEAQIPFKIHIVKDHDLRERLCLEVERLGLSAMIMGSRGFGASKRNSKGRLGSVSDYCVHHCVCPVVVLRYVEKVRDGDRGEVKKISENDGELQPVPEEDQEYHDADDHDQNCCFGRKYLKKIEQKKK